MEKETADKLFCEFALKNDFVTNDQIKAALNAQRVDKVVGLAPEPIHKYFIEQSALSVHQVNVIHQKIQKSEFLKKDSSFDALKEASDVKSEKDRKCDFADEGSVIGAEKNSSLSEVNSSAAGNEIILPCPRCGKESIQIYKSGVSINYYNCKICMRPFSALLAHVRSKKSRIVSGAKFSPKLRNIEVRLVLLNGKEHFLQFQSVFHIANGRDVELKSKDFAAFVFIDEAPLEYKLPMLIQSISRTTSSEGFSPEAFSQIIWVKNFTINQSFKVGALRPCYIATAIYGEFSKEVFALRRFRDEILLPSFILRQFVELYYLISEFLLRAYIYPISNLLIRCFVCPFAYCYSRFYAKRFLRKHKQIDHES